MCVCVFLFLFFYFVSVRVRIKAKHIRFIIYFLMRRFDFILSVCVFFIDFLLILSLKL